MLFTAAVAEVLSIVKRQDKILDIRREVNAAVSFYCQDSDFKRDIEEIALAIDAQQYSANIPYTDLPRFRKFSYIKRGMTNCRLTEINTSKLVSNSMAGDKYYLAGSGIRFNLAKLSTTLDIAFYQYPPILTDAVGQFWMLDLQPYMVIDRAAAKVFNDIGDNDSYMKRRDSANEQYLSWRGDQLSSSS